MNRRFAGVWLFAGALAAGCSPGPVPAGPPPVVVPRANLPGRFVTVGRGPVTSTRTTDLAVFRGRDGRDYALTGTFGNCGGCRGDRVFVWDVTDPARPVRTDSVVMDARIINDVAVNAEGTLAVVSRELARSRRNGIVLLDLSTPAHPRINGEFWETVTGGVHNAAIDGRFAYLADVGTGTMVVVDVSNPADVRQVGHWGLPAHRGMYLHDLSVKDGLAYLAYWDDGLVILDVGRGIAGGSPQAPKLVSQLRYASEWHGARYGHTHYAIPYTNAAGRRYVFVGDEILPADADLTKPFETGGYVHVIDAADPRKPVEVATYDVPGAGVHNFWIERDTLYAAVWAAGIRAVDVSGDLRGSLRNREIAAMSTAGDSATSFLPNLPMAWAAVPYRGSVFVTDFDSGLWVARVERKR
ncbi:MAG: hypothetical protein JWM27_863 [Gemmatimonadetes bacterium]|nr:hypothetical protein [Gemmatimonadota bacterium]